MSTLVLVADADDGTVTSLRLDTADRPRLDRLTATRVGDGAGTLAVDADRDLVYVATKDPAVVTLRLDRDSGALTEVSRRVVDDGLAYVALAHGGSVVVGASYGGGFAAAWPVTDGRLGEPNGRVEHANCHCILPVGDRAYVVSLGEDRVARCRLGPDAALTPLGSAPAPEGSGPRHLVVDGPNAYLVTEYSGEVIRFDVADDGALTPAEAVRIDDPDQNLAHSRMGADPAAEHLRWGADVHLTDDYVLCSERTGSTITAVERRPDGRLGEAVAVSQAPTQPRAFGIAPDGRLVVAVGERSNRALLARIEENGALTDLGGADVGAGARWVAFV